MAANIELSNYAVRRLDLLVSQTGRSKAFYLKEIVERGLEEIEDYYLGTQVAERVRHGEEETFSSGEVGKHLGLDDSANKVGKKPAKETARRNCTERND